MILLVQKIVFIGVIWINLQILLFLLSRCLEGNECRSKYYLKKGIIFLCLIKLLLLPLNWASCGYCIKNIISVKKCIFSQYFDVFCQFLSSTYCGSQFHPSIVIKVSIYRFYNALSQATCGKKLEIFGGHLLSEDDHSHWAPPYWNITKKLLL